MIRNGCWWGCGGCGKPSKNTCCVLVCLPHDGCSYRSSEARKIARELKGESYLVAFLRLWELRRAMRIEGLGQLMGAIMLDLA